MRRQILIFILILLSVRPIVAQRSLSVATNAIGVSDSDIGKFYYAKRNEPPRAIEFKVRTLTATAFRANINRYFNIPVEFTFVESESSTDNLGMQHRLLQQYYKGILLEGMGYRVHEKNGFATSANGRAVRDIKLNTQTSISEEQAFHLAMRYLTAKDTIFQHGKKLIVSKGFTFTPESFSIAFQFDIDVSLIEQWRISIDASTGEILNKVSLVNTCVVAEKEVPPLPYGAGTGLTNYYGTKAIKVEKFENSSRLLGQTENGGIVGTYDFRNVSILSLILFFEFHKVYEFYSSDNTYNDPYQQPAVSVQWAAEQAYEYYFKKHNRNSFDNSGSLIKSYVHVDQGLNNAFWTHNLLAFGDGSDNNPLVELDVVAHELTHGVTQYEAALQYYNESGALNESFSDILGKAAEFDTFGDTATWQVAKHHRDGGIRDLSNPNLKNQPDTYSGDMWYTGYDDSGGVHTNSGVQNFWFYLLCEGGSGVNDHQQSYSVSSIGVDVAARIAYRNLTEYLSNYSDYLDSRIGSLLATSDLYGKTSAIYQEVDKAWDAVGVIDEPIITGLKFYDITATTVKIKGSLLPRGNNVTYHFEYGTTPAFGSSSSSYNYADKVEGSLAGLQSETKYYLRLVATNENGSSFFTSEFITISLKPLVKIKQTVDVTETTATMYGQVNPNSLATSFYFEYGLTSAFGFVTPSSLMSGTTEFVDVSAAVANLQPRQTYYYRLVATNGFASAAAGPVSFFTAVKPVITSYTPVTAPIDAVVTLIGQNFNSMSEKNLVSFGATRGTVISSTSTEIKVKVPAGASLGPISLLDAASGLTAESIREFVPTFEGEFKKEHMQLTVGINDPYVYKAVVQDMDGDNKPDIVASHSRGFSIFQNVNQGGDITSESFIRNTYPRESNYSAFYVADFDGNGLKDVVIPYQDGFQIYPNFSVPGYIFFGVPVDLPLRYLRKLTFNDFDQDGHVDIAGFSYPPEGGRFLTIFRNQNPKGSIWADNFVEQFSMPLPYYLSDLYNDDLNNDGKPDLMAAIIDENSVEILKILKNNSHPGVFEFEEIIEQDSNKGRFPRYTSQDFNEDGWKDIASRSSIETGTLGILENKGTSPNISLVNRIASPDEYVGSAIQPGDINGDGKVDLLLATRNRNLIFLKNETVAGEPISDLSFRKFEEYGQKVGDSETVESNIVINDLNGDGRPEVIRTNSYSYYPRDGYLMEIWQNAPPNCLDPSLVGIKALNYAATLLLPPNATLDQFQIEYAIVGSPYWNRVYATTFNLYSGYSFQLRVRAKCYLGYTPYHYTDFITDCVDANSLSISNVSANSITLQAYNLNSFEIEYSVATKNEWKTVPQNDIQISGLLPGTTYDLRVRGRCYRTPGEFNYRQFTTLCPSLSRFVITDLGYNKARVNWISNYSGNVTVEYSTDNIAWTLIDEAGTMFPLSPAQQYFIRGRFECTDSNSDFIYTSVTTPCPKASTLSVHQVTPFSARINWVDESNTNKYVLTYSTAAGTTKTVETNSTSYNLTDLTAGTKYTVDVAPQCTNTKDFTSITFSTICYVPFNLVVSDITYSSAKLSWSDNFSGLPYAVEYSIAGSNVWLTKETTLTDLLLTDLRIGTKYEVRVHINCLSETAPYVSFQFTTKAYPETVLAPNPTNNLITIYPSQNLIGNRFGIYNNTGSKVVEGMLLDYTIDLSSFSPGLYILRIDGEKNLKIVKY